MIEESLVEGILSTSARAGFYCLVNYIGSAFLYVHRDWATLAGKTLQFFQGENDGEVGNTAGTRFPDLRSTMLISFLKENAEVHRFNGWIFGRRWYKIQLQQNMFREVSATGLGWKTPRLLVATRAKRCAFNQQILDLTDMGLQPEQGEDSGEDLTYLTNWRYTLIYTQTITN